MAKIQTIKINGEVIYPRSVVEAVDGAVTRTVNNLVNYYTKSQTYTQAEVRALIAAIQQFHYEIYANLNNIADPASNVLYLIGPIGEGTDKYEEYVYANNNFVKIGDTSIDLSDYITTQALNTILSDYTPTLNLADVALSGDYEDLTNRPRIPDELSDLSEDSAHRTVTDTEKSTWNAKSDFSGSYNDLTDKPTIPDELADLADDSTHRLVTDSEKTAWNAKYNKPSGGIPSTDMTEGVQQSLGRADSAYQKPGSGIPGTDLESAVQTSLGKADTAYQKPSGGIPKTDLASGVQESLEKADSAVQDVSGKEDKTNKVTSISDQSTDTQYPSAKTVYDAISVIDEVTAAALNDLEERKYEKPSGGIPKTDLASGVIPDISGKEDKSNKVTSLSSTSTDVQYPSAKAVYDALQANHDVVFIAKNTSASNIAALVDAGKLVAYYDEITGFVFILTIYSPPSAATIPDYTIWFTSVAGPEVHTFNVDSSGWHDVFGFYTIEQTFNKVTSLSASSTDTQYPSAKCVYDMIGDVESLLAAI